MTKNDQKWPKLTKKTKMAKMTKNDQKWPKMTKNNQKWPKMTKHNKKMAQNNSRRPKMTKNDAKKLSVTDGRTDGPTDRAGCRVACTRLKMLRTCYGRVCDWKNNSLLMGSDCTIWEIEIFPHVSVYNSCENHLTKKKLVTKMKLFEFASHLRKPHPAISLGLEVILIWMKSFHLKIS